MAATLESQARTRAFARVIGPFLAIVTTLVAVRMGSMEQMVSAFFANVALAWIVGAILIFGGIVIIAFHQIWRGAAAIVISLLGWILVLRGLSLIAVPQLIQQLALSMLGATAPIRIAFALAAALGLWLTYVGWLAKAPTA
jgi:hypothetical protein